MVKDQALKKKRWGGERTHKEKTKETSVMYLLKEQKQNGEKAMDFMAAETNGETTLHVWLFFLLPLCCWPVTSVIHGNQGFPPVSLGSELHTRSFHSPIS